MEHGSLSSMTFSPGLNSLVEKLGIRSKPHGISYGAIIP